MKQIANILFLAGFAMFISGGLIVIAVLPFPQKGTTLHDYMTMMVIGMVLFIIGVLMGAPYRAKK